LYVLRLKVLGRREFELGCALLLAWSVGFLAAMERIEEVEGRVGSFRRATS
jgi:hypothetical protein